MSDKKGASNTISHTLFSRRDKINADSGEGYYPKIYEDGNKQRSQIFLMVSVLTALLVFTFILFLSPNFYNTENIRLFLGTSSQTLGVIIGMIATISFVIIQIHINKFGQEIYRYLVKDFKIISYLLLVFVTLLASLLGILLIDSILLFENKLFLLILIFNPLLCYLSLFLLVFTLCLLPYFIFNLIKRISIVDYLKFLYYRTIDSINDLDNSKNKLEVENNLGLILQITETGIRDRDRGSTQESIETLHDLLKFSINNQEKINSLLNTTYKQEGMFSDHSGWFEEELLSGLYSAYKIAIETNQNNVARHILKAINSCLTESLNYEYGENLREKIISTYQRLILLSVRDKNLEEEVVSLLSYSIEKSFHLNESDFNLFTYKLFEETFVISLLKERPEIIQNIFMSYFHNIDKGSLFGKLDNINIVTLIERINSTLIISRKLVELKELNSHKDLFFNKMFEEQLSELEYLLSLFILSKNDLANAKKCKVIIKEKIDFKKLNEKIKKIVTDKNDFKPLINYIAHKLFMERKENGETKFEHKKLIKLSNDFNLMRETN